MSLPILTPQSGEVLIRVKAFRLNRSEMFTRQGHSADVKFPRAGHRGGRTRRVSARNRVPQVRCRHDRDGRQFEGGSRRSLVRRITHEFRPQKTNESLSADRMHSQCQARPDTTAVLP